MLEKEVVIRKIKGLLAKAEDQRDDAESQNALVMAKKWMLKYHIQEEDLRDSEMCAQFVRHFERFEWWEELLAGLIAEHFRVRAYYQWEKNIPSLYFYGLRRDLEYAKEMFELAYASVCFFTANHLSKQQHLSKKVQRSSQDDYISGFLRALQEKFQRQNQVVQSHASRELMLVLGVPVQVQEAFQTLTQSFQASCVKLPEVSDLHTYKKAYHDALTLDWEMSRLLLEEVL